MRSKSQITFKAELLSASVFPTLIYVGINELVRGVMSVRASVSTLPVLATQPRKDELEMCLRSYGANSTSYVLLEGAKRYFRSPRVAGFIAYEVRAGVAVIGGDPVCAVADAPALLVLIR